VQNFKQFTNTRETMKQALVITFDYYRVNEDRKSYSIASILAYLKRHADFQKKFYIQHLSFSMPEIPKSAVVEYFSEFLNPYNLKKIDSIVLSVYIWNDYLINGIINLSIKRGFRGNIILGGHQINCMNPTELTAIYPKASVFIQGYGEKSLLQAILLEKQDLPLILNEKLIANELPSVYLNEELTILQQQDMVRMETKRGCPYSCSFCSFRDLKDKCVYQLPINKVFQELSFLQSKQVQKINVIDPVFNHGKNYLEILDEIIRLKMKSHFTFQSRFELIKSNAIDGYLDKVSLIKSTLEFGLQSVNTFETNGINRKNDISKVKFVMNELNLRNINYEISIIYGLPFQNVDSFQTTIDFIKSNGCKNIKAFPLMLLRGTELYYMKEKLNLKVEMDDFNIPYVTSGNSFTKNEYLKMKEIANNL